MKSTMKIHYKLLDKEGFHFYVAAANPVEAINVAVSQWPSLTKTSFISIQEQNSIAVEVN